MLMAYLDYLLMHKLFISQTTHFHSCKHVPPSVGSEFANQDEWTKNLSYFLKKRSISHYLFKVLKQNAAKYKI